MNESLKGGGCLKMKHRGSPAGIRVDTDNWFNIPFKTPQYKNINEESQYVKIVFA